MGWLQRIIGKDGTNASTTANGVPVHTGTAVEAGFVVNTYELDSGSITGLRHTRAPFVSEDSRLNVGIDTVLATYNYTSNAQDTAKTKHGFVTMTMTKSNGFLNINPGLATVSGNYAYLQSFKHFTLLGDAGLQVVIIGQITAMPPASQILETGLFIGTAGVAPADGVFFRLTNAGLYGIITYNGVETPTGIMAASVPSGTNGEYRILISQRIVSFWINGILGAEMVVPAANAIPYLTMSLPLTYMMRNSGTVTGGMTTKIGTAHVTQTDLHTSKPWSEQMAMQGNAYQGQDGDAVGSLAIYSNAGLAAAAALSNTTAAAGNTGLGGAVLVLPTLGTGTDGILFSYQNPIGSITQPPKTLVVKGINVSAGIQVVLAGGPLVYAIGIAYGHAAVSLVTTESASFSNATTKAPRRVLVGTLNCVAAAVAGTALTGNCYMKFDSPITVNPGEFFQVTARNTGTVTTTGAVLFTAALNSYFE